MKKYYFLLIISFIIPFSVIAETNKDVNITKNAKSSILIEATTGNFYIIKMLISI